MTPAEDDGKPMLRGAGDNLLKNFKKEPEIVPKIPDRHLFSGILYIEGDAGHVLRFEKPVKSLTIEGPVNILYWFERPVKSNVRASPILCYNLENQEEGAEIC